MLNDYSYNFDSKTGQYVDGIGYEGEGFITEVSSSPEPATATLIALGFVGMIVLRCRRARA
jgi:hypothetical protein